MKRFYYPLFFALVFFAGIIVGIYAFSIYSSNITAGAAAGSVRLEQDIKKVIRESVPSVFTVLASGASTESPHGRMSGSAFIFKEKGKDIYLITNFHVIESADSVIIIDGQNRRIAAQIIGSDPLKDIAVLKAANIYGYRPLKIARGPYEQGTFVIAAGSPYAFMNTVTFGIISATGRRLSTRFGYEIEGVIQTDAPINQGNSGGPLLDLKGRVVGVNTAIFSLNGAFQGIGFAIPADEAERIADRIISEGEIVTRIFGISCADFDKSVANSFNLPVDGVLIMCLYPESPLSKAGLRPTQGLPGDSTFILGDIIVEVDGVRVRSLSDLSRIIAEQNKKSYRVKYFRDGKFFEGVVEVR